MNSPKTNNKLFSFLFIIVLLASVSAQARFNYQKDANGNWLASTITNSKDGLGQILRQLGVEPNWTNRSWIKEIKNINYSTIGPKGNILNYNKNLTIPINALKDCKGYSRLILKLSGINTAKNNIPVEPVKLKTIEVKPQITNSVKISPVPPLVKNKTEGLGSFFINPLRYFHLWAGLGISRATNSDTPNDTSTTLLTDASYHFGTSFKLSFSNKIESEFFAQADYKKYKDPDNLTIQQNKKLYLSYGLNLAYWLNSNFRIGVFGESVSTPRSQLTTSATITVTNDSFIKVGPSLLMPFSVSSPSDLTIDIRPSFILSKELNSIEYDNGYGFKTIINYYFNQSPLFIGLDFNYEDQNYDSADNGLIEGFFKVGYAL